MKNTQPQSANVGQLWDVNGNPSSVIIVFHVIAARWHNIFLVKIFITPREIWFCKYWNEIYSCCGEKNSQFPLPDAFHMMKPFFELFTDLTALKERSDSRLRPQYLWEKIDAFSRQKMTSICANLFCQNFNLSYKFRICVVVLFWLSTDEKSWFLQFRSSIFRHSLDQFRSK